jgi:hypothetical protein
VGAIFASPLGDGQNLNDPVAIVWILSVDASAVIAEPSVELG